MARFTVDLPPELMEWLHNRAASRYGGDTSMAIVAELRMVRAARIQEEARALHRQETGRSPGVLQNVRPAGVPE